MGAMGSVGLRARALPDAEELDPLAGRKLGNFLQAMVTWA
jgi:hypothetical protein